MDRGEASSVSHEQEDNEKELIDLLQLLETIPDALIDYYMAKAGVTCDDLRLKRLIALIGQKFITDIANDAIHHQKMRSNAPGSRGGGGTGTIGGSSGTSSSSKKNVLTIDDLAAALADYGINIKRPQYYT